MHPRSTRVVRWSAIASIFGALALGPRASLGEEPPIGSRLGRLFRMGAPASSKPPAADSKPDAAANPYASPPSPSTIAADSRAATGPAPRIVPQPRVSRPVTESDPILSRLAIGRTDDGKQFGMALMVYADGTVLDGEGVHHVGPDLLRPLVQAIQATEAARVHGHCGAPATDFIEQVHVVVYERSYNKLRASSFSYSGNPGGCDPSIKRLHVAVEAIQSRIAGTPPAAPASAAPIGSPSPSLSPTPNLDSPTSPIPLTGPGD